MFNKLKSKAGENFPKSKKNSRIFKVVLCFAIALALTASIFVGVQSQKDVVSVVKSMKTLQPGDKIKSSDLELVEVGKYGLSDKVLKSEDEVVGKYVKEETTIYPDDYITTEKLTSEKQDPFSSIKSGKGIMSFTVPNLAASVANNLRVGDTIQVIYSEQVADPTGMSTGGYNVVTADCLKKLTVIDIKDAAGVEPNDSKSSSANLYKSEEFIPSVITVEVDDAQALELSKAELSKNVFVVFKERGSSI